MPGQDIVVVGFSAGGEQHDLLDTGTVFLPLDQIAGVLTELAGIRAAAE